MILITGATGTVGSEVIKRLSAQGKQVCAVTRDLKKAETNRLPNVQFVKADFDDPNSMRAACADAERAFLLTSSTERAEKQQIEFVRVAQKSGVRHIVKVSQLHADIKSPGRFLRYHAAVESAVQAASMTFTFLRPNLYMQGLLNFRQSIKHKSAFFKSYSLTGPEALTFADMAEQLSAALGRTIAFVDIPPEAMRGALADMGFPAWQADGLLEEFAMYRGGEAAGVESGVAKALNRSPRSFGEFARDYAPLFA
jgi:uncharacterized protein YbjT (DUF2867 family)